MGVEAVLLLWTVLLLSNGPAADGRQMCWSCQFVLNGRGKECATSPSNWTGGEPRLRCPYRCVIMAEFDAVTGKPTFFHRGCGTTDNQAEDGCNDNGSRHSCFFSCGDGDNYCNDKPLASSPLLEDEGNSAAFTFRVVPPRAAIAISVIATYLVTSFRQDGLIMID